MSIFLAPHNDDEALFGSIIIQRYKPMVVVVTDSFRQFEFGITANQRRAESEAACAVLGVRVEFMGIADHRLNMYRFAVIDALRNELVFRHDMLIFAPAEQNGHADHDLVSWVAESMDARVIYYTTYGKAKDNYIQLMPTAEEFQIKMKALDCYPSQRHTMKMPYFEQMQKNPSEFISELP